MERHQLLAGKSSRRLTAATPAFTREARVFAVAALLSAVLASCAGLSPDDNGLTYVAVGASDALGIGAVPLRKGYVFRIKEELDKQVSPVDLLLVGLPAAKIADLKTAVITTLRARLRPDLVTLWTGANDIIAGEEPAEFETVLGVLLRKLAGDTPALVVLANVPDLTKLPRFRREPSPHVTLERVTAFNAAIARQATAAGALVIDMFAEDVRDAFVGDIDGFHPTNRGHWFAAKLFSKAILPRLARTRLLRSSRRPPGPERRPAFRPFRPGPVFLMRCSGEGRGEERAKTSRTEGPARARCARHPGSLRITALSR